MVRLQVPPSPKPSSTASTPAGMGSHQARLPADDANESPLPKPLFELRTGSAGPEDSNELRLLNSVSRKLAVGEQAEGKNGEDKTREFNKGMMSISEVALMRRASGRNNRSAVITPHRTDSLQSAERARSVDVTSAEGAGMSTARAYASYTSSPAIRTNTHARSPFVVDKPRWSCGRGRGTETETERRSLWSSEEDGKASREAVSEMKEYTDQLIKDARQRLIAQGLVGVERVPQHGTSPRSHIKPPLRREISAEQLELERQVLEMELDIQAWNSGEIDNALELKPSEIFGSTANFAKVCHKFGMVSAEEVDVITHSMREAASARTARKNPNPSSVTRDQSNNDASSKELTNIPGSPAPSLLSASSERKEKELSNGVAARARLFDSPRTGSATDVDEAVSLAVYLKEDYDHITAVASRKATFAEQLREDLAGAVDAKAQRIEVRDLFPGLVVEVFVHPGDATDARTCAQVARDMAGLTLGTGEHRGALRNATSIKVRGAAAQVKPLSALMRSMNMRMPSLGLPTPPPLPMPPNLMGGSMGGASMGQLRDAAAGHADVVEAVLDFNVQDPNTQLAAERGARIRVEKRDLGTGWGFGRTIEPHSGALSQAAGWFPLAYVRAVDLAGGAVADVMDVTIDDSDGSSCCSLLLDDTYQGHTSPRGVEKKLLDSGVHCGQGGDMYIEVVEAMRLPAAAGLLPDTYCCVSLFPLEQAAADRPLLGHSADGRGKGVTMSGKLVFNLPPQYSTSVYKNSTCPKWRSSTLLKETRPTLMVVGGGRGQSSELVSVESSILMRGQPVLLLVTVHERMRLRGEDRIIGGDMLEIFPGGPIDTLVSLKRHDGSLVANSTGPAQVRIRVAYPSHGAMSASSKVFLPSPPSSSHSSRSVSPHASPAGMRVNGGSSRDTHAHEHVRGTERIARRMANKRREQQQLVEGTRPRSGSPLKYLVSPPAVVARDVQRALSRSPPERERDRSMQMMPLGGADLLEEEEVLQSVEVEIVGISGLSASFARVPTHCCVSVLLDEAAVSKSQKRDLLMTLRHMGDDEEQDERRNNKGSARSGGSSTSIPPQSRTRALDAGSRPAVHERMRFREGLCITKGRVYRRELATLRGGASLAVFVSVHESSGESRVIGKGLVSGLIAEGGAVVDRHVVLLGRHGQVCDPKTAEPARVHVRVRLLSSPGSPVKTPAAAYEYSDVVISDDETDAQDPQGEGALSLSVTGEVGKGGGSGGMHGVQLSELDKAIRARERGAEYLAKVLGNKSPPKRLLGFARASPSPCQSRQSPPKPVTSPKEPMGGVPHTLVRRFSNVQLKAVAPSSPAPSSPLQNKDTKEVTNTPTANSSPVVKEQSPMQGSAGVAQKVSLMKEAANKYRAIKGLNGDV